MTIAGWNPVNVLVMLVKIIEDRLAHFPSFAGRISKNGSTPQQKSHAKRPREFHPKSAQPIPKPPGHSRIPPLRSSHATQVVSAASTGGGVAPGCYGSFGAWMGGLAIISASPRMLSCCSRLFKWVGRCWNYWYQLDFW